MRETQRLLFSTSHTFHLNSKRKGSLSFPPIPPVFLPSFLLRTPRPDLRTDAHTCVTAGGGAPPHPVFGAAGWLSESILQLDDLVLRSLLANICLAEE